MKPVAAVQQSATPSEEAASPPTLLYSSERTRIYRSSLADGSSIVCKEPLGSDALMRVRNEREILAKLEGVAGVPQLAAAGHRPSVVALHDVEGVPLSRMLVTERLALAEVLQLAIALGRILVAIHARSVVHGDINPCNILMRLPERRPLLIDYHLAFVMADPLPDLAPARMAGTLAYMAPEQTGRTGRAVDHRADLYAFGATLYELVVGRPPFVHADVLQLVHEQLTRIPTAPATLVPGMPALLSDLIMRLLEKDPERRYQSADGLCHDLGRIAAQLDAGTPPDFPLAARDFPMRLTAPRKLVGRQAEHAALLDAFERAMRGEIRGVLLTGPEGVGKSRLVAQLRRRARERGGYFVAGEFDSQRKDRQASGLYTALRALGRLLLAEPEAELSRLRQALLAALGVNVALAADHLPEFAILLGVAAQAQPAAGGDTPARLLAATETLLRTVASPRRPLVIAFDRVESAHASALRMLDNLLLSPDIPGLLLVAEWRDDASAAAPAPSSLLPSWVGKDAVRIALTDLSRDEAGLLLGEMLRMPAQQAEMLAAALAEHTGGNPYYTVELVNALREGGVLLATDDGWTWDPEGLRRHVGCSSIANLLHARLERLPTDARTLMDVMACLGGQVRGTVLATAAGIALDTLPACLAPALDDGLLTMDARIDEALAIGFPHERVRQAALDAIGPDVRAALQLAIARRLDGVPDAISLAAAQYLPLAASLDAAERLRAVALFRQAAATSTDAGESERLLRTALESIPDAGADGHATTNTIRRELHATLLRLGRNEDADALFEIVDGSGMPPVELAHAACLQISSLLVRRRTPEALALGIRMLEKLGFAFERLDRPALQEQLAAFEHWLQDAVASDPLALPEAGSARVRVIAMLLERCASAAFTADGQLLGSIVFSVWRLWRDEGVAAPMIGALAYVGMVASQVRSDFRLGYATVRYLLALAAARGYTIEGARVRWMLAVTYGHWFEPVEQCVDHGRQAHDIMLQGGDLLATLPLIPVVGGTFETAPTLSATEAEANAALGVVLRSGSFTAAPYFHDMLALARTLQGDEAGEPPSTNATAPTPVTHFNQEFALALQGALMGDAESLAVHAEAAYAARRVLHGAYKTALAIVLHAVGQAQRAQAAEPGTRPALLAPARHCRDELARRALDAPANFAHLVAWVDAECAWADGTYQGAAQAFDDAICALEGHPRPWHRALITERAALFHLAHGMRWSGRRLLAEARRHYLAWGATSKVAQLERSHPFLAQDDRQLPAEGPRRDSVSADSFDLLGLLRSSQALSSETSLDKLHRRVVEQLEAMTGATHVQLVLFQDDGHSTLVGVGNEGATQLAIEDAAAAGLLPMSAVRYVERTRLVLAIDDARRDDRFAADPYLQEMAQCSMLLLPVLNQGALRAVLVLENNQRRGAFCGERVEAVLLIAGQLAVSLDNAMLYASLEEKVAQRTEELEKANRELAALSVTDALTGLANRRRFNETLDAEWLRTMRQDIPLGAAMIDVDQFKLYNDNHGHQQGDACLKQVAEVLARHVRNGVDLAARYGGEEFALILPGADMAEARVVAERIRRAVEALRIPHPFSRHGIVTISVGIASMLPARGVSPATLFGAADAALYDAKETGRNRVNAAGE